MNRILSGTVACAIAVSASTLAKQDDSPLDDNRVATGQGQKHLQRVQTPTTERIDVSAQPAFENRLAACHLVGHVTLWVSRPMRVLDETHEDMGVVEAGLAQFGKAPDWKGACPTVLPWTCPTDSRIS